MPVVVWVRNPTRTLAQLDERRIAYRYLSLGAPVVEPETLPRAVASPSIAADPDGNLRLAFTVGEDIGAFIGNQRTLHTAGAECVASVCNNWEAHRLVDKYHRAIRGERPQLLIKPSGEAALALRLLGFGEPPAGVNTDLINDPQGVIFGTGVVAITEAHFAAVPHTFDFQSPESVGVHQVATMHDPLNDAILVAHVELGPQILGPLRGPANIERNARTRLVDPTQPVLVTTTPRQPNFSIVGVDAPLYPSESETFSITVHIANEGQAWRAGGGVPVTVEATWNRGYRVGVGAGRIGLTEIGSQGLLSVTVPISPAVDLLQRQTLVVTVNPNSTVAEFDRDDNVYTVTIGGLPSPRAVAVMDRPGRSPVYLRWDAVDDERVVGYRIYRVRGVARDIDALEPVGTSLTNGFVDTRTVLDETYTYAVTSYAADGHESDLGPQVLAQTTSVGVPTAIETNRVELNANRGQSAMFTTIATLLTFGWLVLTRRIEIAGDQERDA